MVDMSEPTTDIGADLMASMSQCGISLEAVSLSTISGPGCDYDPGRLEFTYRSRSRQPEQALVTGLKAFGMTAIVIRFECHVTNLLSARAIYRRVRYGRQWQAMCVATGKMNLARQPIPA